jgi:hypothetical protein
MEQFTNVANNDNFRQRVREFSVINYDEVLRIRTVLNEGAAEFRLMSALGLCPGLVTLQPHFILFFGNVSYFRP